MQKIFSSSKLKSSEVKIPQFLPVAIPSSKATFNFATGNWTSQGEFSKYTQALEEESRHLTRLLTEARVNKGLLEQLLASKSRALEQIREDVRQFLSLHQAKLLARGVPVEELLSPIT